MAVLAVRLDALSEFSLDDIAVITSGIQKMHGPDSAVGTNTIAEFTEKVVNEATSKLTSWVTSQAGSNQSHKNLLHIGI